MEHLSSYWQNLSADDKRALADRCETSVAYLSQVFNEHRQASHKFARKLAAATGNAVTKEQLRPDIFDPPEEEVA